MTGMHTCQVTSEQRKRALANMAKLPSNPRNSIRQGAGQVAGCLGEVASADHFRVSDQESTHDYDLRIPGFSESGEALGLFRIDVKTKDRNVPVDMDRHDATVSAYNTKQRCHYYLFVSTQKPHRDATINEMNAVHLIGFLRKDKTFAPENFRQQGSIDPKASQRQIASGTGFYHCDCYSVNYQTLMKVREDGRLVIPNEDVEYFRSKGLLPSQLNRPVAA